METFSLTFVLPGRQFVTVEATRDDETPIRLVEGSLQDLDRHQLDTLDAWVMG